MMGKRNSSESSSSWRRPLTEKLSGLLGRRSSTKSKSESLPVAEDKSSTFKGLQVDLSLGGSDLAEGWLQTSGDDGRKKSPASPGKSAAPIAYLFTNKSALGLSLSPEKPQPPQESSTNLRQSTAPSVMESKTISHRRSANFTSYRESEISGSILDRGRPVEPRHFLSEWPKKPEAPLLSAHVESATSQSLTPISIRDVRIHTAKSEQPAQPEVAPVVKKRPTARHSMLAAVPAPSPPEPAPVPETRPTVGQRSVSSTPVDRIKAWQKTVTPSPSPAPSGSSTDSTAAPTSVMGPPAKKPSTRGVASDRLAWIRELEGKKSSSVNSGVPAKKTLGSVSDRLAMFEKKQTLATPPTQRLPPLTRSNSTTSRLSWGAMDSTASVNGNAAAATPRTSIDTARSSHRPPSIMSHYDESFREKLESIAGYTPDQEKSEAQAIKRRSVGPPPSIKAKKAEEEPQSSEVEAPSAPVEVQKQVEVPAAQEIVAAPAQVVEDVKVEKPEEKEIAPVPVEKAEVKTETPKAQDTVVAAESKDSEVKAEEKETVATPEDVPAPVKESAPVSTSVEATSEPETKVDTVVEVAVSPKEEKETPVVEEEKAVEAAPEVTAVPVPSEKIAEQTPASQEIKAVPAEEKAEPSHSEVEVSAAPKEAETTPKEIKVETAPEEKVEASPVEMPVAVPEEKPEEKPEVSTTEELLEAAPKKKGKAAKREKAKAKKAAETSGETSPVSPTTEKMEMPSSPQEEMANGTTETERETSLTDTKV
ncbi:hypothetical protein B0I35DRAFT_426294 [Stachybotrys elegans]|uniref:Uncharacterized protein n=1 Tax=Stachybotrys elegans TaxID=80388 RepID=A0A8K0T0Z2_9HYPO|nr:hypothetical protein B0I35DRAFT_426294 [Stachybotrys elegans]